MDGVEGKCPHDRWGITDESSDSPVSLRFDSSVLSDMGRQFRYKIDAKGYRRKSVKYKVVYFCSRLKDGFGPSQGEEVKSKVTRDHDLTEEG